MAIIRIRGLVRAARNARARVRAGIDDDERGRFLSGVRGVVERADELLAANNMSDAHLPTPSRNALAELRSLARLSPSALLDPDPAGPSRLPVRLGNVVRTLGRCLDDLSDGPTDQATIASVRSDAGFSADAIEKLCAEQGGHTAGLPKPSRSAYAMLRWLSGQENLDRYLGQIRFLVGALPRLWQSVTGTPSVRVARAWVRPQGALIRAVPHNDYTAWSLAIGCLTAEEDDLRALLECTAHGRHASECAREAQIGFLRSEAYGAMNLELEFLADPAPFQARGLVYDLDMLFERLDRMFFRGRLEKPHLDWRQMHSRTTYGVYVPPLDLACVNPVLDDAAVPEFVAEVVLYHELLHKKHGIRIHAGRAHAHTPAFKAEERLHPQLADCDRWLSALASGLDRPRERNRPPPPPEAPELRRVLHVPAAEPSPRTASGRNDSCWCGSGRKYKRCHLDADRRR